MTRHGPTSLDLGSISLGTAPLGGLYSSASGVDVNGLVDAAIEAGIRYFDTAPLYGHGTAERRLGAALSRHDRDSVIISTKVGRLVVAPASGHADTGIFADAPNADVAFAFDGDSILRSIEASLDRLGTDRIDILYIHDPDDFADQAIRESYPVLHRLREEGVVSAIGVGMNQTAVPTRFVRETDIDVVLIAGRNTLLDQSAADDLLPAALDRGVSIVVGGAFNSGILADPDNCVMYDYRPASDEILRRVGRVRSVCERHGVSLPCAAIAFAQRNPAVSTVLLGARSIQELSENLVYANTTVPEELWTELAEEGLVRPDES